MTELSRRSILKSSAALCAAALLPLPVPVIAEAAPAAVSAPLGLAWSVGTPDEWDWQHVIARTEDEARLFWCEEHVGFSECQETSAGTAVEECECEFCSAFGSTEAGRQPEWDGKAKIGPADWIRVGMGCYCNRCGEEAYAEADENHAIIVGEEVVHEECMTLADWDIKDPVRAAQIRADMAEA